MNFLNTLTWWQWVMLGAVPPAIISLYFLKLKRQPLEVPSTYLWTRTIEDLHVNSIWQRLRQSLLLFLQLLLVMLAMAACLRPGWRGTELTGDRLIFLIDTSASMSATDVAPNRLENAKRQVLALVDQMERGDVGMVISFSDAARVEQSFTSNRSLLRQKIQRVQATNRPSDLGEALRAAAGLANPGRTSEEGSLVDVQVAEALPASLYIYSDGGFSSIPSFSLGNLEPTYIPVGDPNPGNTGIVTFTTDRNPERPDKTQAYARFENHGEVDAEFTADLYVDGELIDATIVNVPANGSSGAQFELETPESAVLRLSIDVKDHLTLDNQAYAVVNSNQVTRVLLVTPGNDPLRQAMSTEQATQLAAISVVEPAYLETDDYRHETAASIYDLIVYDRCVPASMPQANTFFIGRAPPIETWSEVKQKDPPIIIDSDRLHPLMKLIELGNVVVVETSTVTPPTGGATLIDADAGGLLAIGPREGFEDAVMGFEIISVGENGAAQFNTDWPLRQSFPVFVLNVLEYLGGSRNALSAPSAKPGASVVIRSATAIKQVRVKDPGGQTTRITPDTQNTFVYVATQTQGAYEVCEDDGKEVTQRFAVNLFDSQESDLTPRPAIKLEHEEVQGQANLVTARKELWRWLLLGGLLVLVFEWYVYNRRVYL